MKIQYEEAEYLYIKNRALDKKQDLDTSEFEKEFEKLVSKFKLNDDEKQSALVKLFNRHVKAKEKN